MARKQVATGLLIASLVLLIVYGADVMVASSSPPSTLGAPRNGFLPFNEAIRGSVFGGGAVIMSIIGFIIARREPSVIISILLYVNGGVILAGMIALIGQGALAGPNSARAAGTVSSTMVLGGVLIGLGIWKSIGDRRQVAKKQHA